MRNQELWPWQLVSDGLVNLPRFDCDLNVTDAVFINAIKGELSVATEYPLSQLSYSAVPIMVPGPVFISAHFFVWIDALWWCHTTYIYFGTVVRSFCMPNVDTTLVLYCDAANTSICIWLLWKGKCFFIFRFSDTVVVARYEIATIVNEKVYRFLSDDVFFPFSSSSR